MNGATCSIEPKQSVPFVTKYMMMRPMTIKAAKP